MSESNSITVERQLELLAYAKVCFENRTTPFAPIHISKKKVTVDECNWLSQHIAELLDGILIDEGVLKAQEAVEQAEIEFEETQK